MSRTIKARSPGHDWLEAQNAHDIRLLFGWNVARESNRHFFIQLHGNCFVVITVALQVVGASNTHTHTRGHCQSFNLLEAHITDARSKIDRQKFNPKDFAFLPLPDDA